MQKLVHICLLGAFTPNGTYQDNILPKYHAKQGLEVSLITSKWQQDGKGGYCIHPQTDYWDENGVHVLRLSMKGKENLGKRFKWFPTLCDTLEQIKPDILFVHGVQMLNIFTIKSYVKKHPEVKLYVDSHADFSNSARTWLSKNILHKILWRICAHIIEPYTTKFYGVLPARVDFLRKMYGLPAEKCELLVMGVDDEMVEKAADPQVRTKIRKKYGIKEDDFLIVTGGKINVSKKQTLLLMQAVQNIQNPNIKLLVFGSVSSDLKEKVNELADGQKVQYIGWINGQDSYQYFAAADLVCFPGRHSVFWEQVVGQGIPLIVKDWPGTHHIDIGGNVRFLTQDSTEEIQQTIEKLVTCPELYEKMKQHATSEKRKRFFYGTIAKEAIL